MALALLTTLVLALAVPALATAETGTVQTYRFADTPFGAYTRAPTRAQQSWMRNHLWRMTAWSPYFDSRTSWYGNALAYKDAYAIYAGSSLAAEHPDWIARDPTGAELYVQYGCSNGTCPELAADITNAAFRKWWIESARATVAHGYRGLYIDDANMEMRVGDGLGQALAPLDPATGTAMTGEAWRRYMAQFLEQIRAALPGAELIDNTIWFAAPTRLADPYVQRGIAAANGVYLERGVNDAGLTGGSGEWSLDAFLAYAEAIKSRGRFVVMGNGSTSRQGETYDLASYLLVSDGGDAIDVGGATPYSWWSGWETRLGEATGPRYQSGALMRRAFSAGQVIVNPPGGRTQTVTLGTAMIDADGNRVSSVTLPAASGAVLRLPAPTGMAEPAFEAYPEAGPSETPPPPPLAAQSPLVEPFPGVATALDLLSPGWVPTRTVLTAVGTVAGRRRAGQTAADRHRVRLVIGGVVLGADHGTATVVVQVRHGRRWWAIARLAARVARSGRFVAARSLQAGITYRISALFAGGTGLSPSRSGYSVIVPHAV